MIDFWTRGDCTPASPRHRTTWPVGGQHCATSPQSCMQSHRLWLFTDLDQLQALQTACAVPLLLRTRRCSEPGIDDDSERGMRLGIMMTPNLDLRWDPIAILASSSWLEPKKFALTACFTVVIFMWLSLGIFGNIFPLSDFPHNISQHTLLTISLWFHYTCLLFLCQEFLQEVATPEFLKNYRMMVKAKKAKLEVFYFTWRPQKKKRNSHFLKTVHFFI